MTFEFDKNYEKRAKFLIDDAINEALNNNTRFEPAIRGYAATRDLKAKVAGFIASTGAGMGATYAATAIGMAVGAAAGTVTLGIAPAVGFIAGIAIAKAGSAIRYQLASGKLIEGIRYNPNGEDFIENPALLEPAAKKVLTKADRVITRYDQRRRGIMSTFRKMQSPIVAVRASLQNTEDARSAMDVFPGWGADADSQHLAKDIDLNHRLFELRYYGQMLLNFVEKQVKQAIEQRNKLLDDSMLIYGHVIRQVHFTGNHDDCAITNCYNMSQQDLNAAERQLESEVRRLLDQEEARKKAAAGGKGMSDVQKADYKKDQKKHFKDAETSALKISPEHLQASLDMEDRKKKKLGDPNHMLTNITVASVVQDRMRDVRMEAAEHANTAFDYGLGMAMEVGGDALGNTQYWLGSSPVPEDGASFMQHIRDLDAMGESTKAHDSNFGGAAGLNALLGAVVGQTIEEIRDTVSNRLTKYGVTKKTNRLFDALTADQSTQANWQSAYSEVGAILKKKEISDRLLRVSQKCLWYHMKIGELQKNYNTVWEALRLENDYSQSQFASCKQAKDLAFSLNYLFKQYDKWIVHLIYLEMILIQLDEKICSTVGIPSKSLVRANASVDSQMIHPRPPHMNTIDRSTPSPLLSAPPALQTAPPPPQTPGIPTPPVTPPQPVTPPPPAGPKPLPDPFDDPDL